MLIQCQEGDSVCYNRDMDKPARDILISHAQIEAKIKEIARQIAGKYRGKNLLILAVLNGSILLASDLLRALWQEGLTDVTLDTVCITSYGRGREAIQKPELLKDVRLDIAERHVLVVEDIIDTGETLAFLLGLLQKRHPASLKMFTLLSKPSRRKTQIEAEYTGFVIDDLWVEGYGLDTDGKYRGNPNICFRKS